MRRLELLIKHLRESVETPHNDGDTDSLSNLEFIQYLNDGQDVIFAEIVNSHMNFFLTTGTIDIVASQQQYTLPSDIYLGSKIKKVEFKYGGANAYYRILPVSEFDLQTDFTCSIPSGYTRGKDYLKLTPLPSVSVTDGLRVTYTKKPRRLDIRRGVVASIAKTGSTLNTITLDLTPALGKDSGTTSAARDLLNETDYICVVDADGAPVLEAIPINSYNSSTGVITVRSGFTTTLSSGDLADKYIVSGNYSTTHSELPDCCERYLILFSTYKLLRRGGNQFETTECKNEMTMVGNNILDSFGNPDDDIYYLKVDPHFDD